MVSSVQAHQSGLSFVNIVKEPTGLLHITYKKPLSDTRSSDITINYPTQCTQVTPTEKTILNGFIIRTSSLNCGKKGLHDSRIWVKGLVSSDRGVLIRYDDKEHIYKSLLRAATPFITINHKLSRLHLFFEYVHMGIMHILTGFDHLSFVLGLLILGTVTINTAYVEAMIALSILFLAKELTTYSHSLWNRFHFSFLVTPKSS